MEGGGESNNIEGSKKKGSGKKLTSKFPPRGPQGSEWTTDGDACPRRGGQEKTGEGNGNVIRRGGKIERKRQPLLLPWAVVRTREPFLLFLLPLSPNCGRWNTRERERNERNVCPFFPRSDGRPELARGGLLVGGGGGTPIYRVEEGKTTKAQTTQKGRGG